MTQRQYLANIASEQLPDFARKFDSPLDRWISYAVKVLTDGGIETFESCQGGPGHAYHEPSVRFYGQEAEGFRAFAVAVSFGLPVRDVSRIWMIVHGELTGPYWQMTFHRAPLRKRQRDAEQAGLLKIEQPRRD